MSRREVTLLLVAIIGCLFVVTYLLRVPFVLFDPGVVGEYYETRAFPNVWHDVLFVGMYLVPSLICRVRLKWSCVHSVLVAAATTAVLTGAACALFRARPYDANNFFSKWFHQVGYGAVVYDTILVVLTLLAFERLRQ